MHGAANSERTLDLRELVVVVFGDERADVVDGLDERDPCVHGRLLHVRVDAGVCHDAQQTTQPVPLQELRAVRVCITPHHTTIILSTTVNN